MSIDSFRGGDAGSLRKSIIDWRRHLHQHPELSGREIETSAYVYKTLNGLPALKLSRPTPTSVLAVLKGGKPGRTIALRADMDALPITEETGAAYASLNKGVMHACGHDGHTTMLLAAATVLAQNAESLHGELRFIFQHSEENSPGGAIQLVEAGVLKGVDAIIGAHLLPQYEAGTFGIVYGPAMASLDTFEIEILGKGGHAAMPHTAVDPIAIGAQVVEAFQHIVSRNTNPFDSAVLSVTQFQAGTAFNVIPPTAWMAGSVRTFTEEARDTINKSMDRILAGVTAAHGADYRMNYSRKLYPVDNDEAVTASVERSLKRTLGGPAVRRVQPLMASEDFSIYQQKTPGCFYFIGAGNAAKGINHPLHDPRFDMDEEALVFGARALVGAAVDLLNE
jgi:amidohydrolase